VKAGNKWVSGNIPKHWQPFLTTPSPGIAAVATALRDLQEARHQADYDVAAKHYRTQVLALIRVAKDAFATWQRVKSTDEAALFLLDALELAGRSP
jgi:hypothetical protein